MNSGTETTAVEQTSRCGFGGGLRAGDAIAAAFFVTALGCVLSHRFTSDEGLLTLLGAQVTRDAFLAGFFFQKLHPTLSLLYLPTAGLGWTAFGILHALVAALGVSAVGRWIDLNGGRGWLAALVFAGSPAYFFAATTGQSNADSVALLALALLLFDSRKARCRLASGLLLGALPWARYEMAALVGPLVAYALLGRRDTALCIGAVLFPLLYLIGGAAYHGSLAWMLTYPPVEPLTNARLEEAFHVPVTVDTLYRLLSALALTSTSWAVGLISVRSSSVPATGRVVLLAGMVLLVLFCMAPFFELNGPEHTPRYLMVCLPSLAVALAFTLPSARWTSVVGFVVAAVTLALLLSHRSGAFSPTLLVLVSGVAPLALSLSRPQWRVGIASAVALSSFVGVVVSTTLAKFEDVLGPAYQASAVLRAAAATPSALIVTDIKRLPHRLRSLGWKGRTAYIPAFDVCMGVDRLTNHDNGQYASIVASFRTHYMDGLLWPCDLERHEFQVGDLVVLGSDWRQAAIVPPEVWRQRTEHVVDADGATILRVTSGPAPIHVPPPPGWLGNRIFEAPCEGHLR